MHLLLSALAPGPGSRQGCPWDFLAEYGPPNVKWCEERLCAWVNEPANAWSNLAYILVALFLFFTARARAGTRLAGALRWFPPIIATVGVCSLIYHASNTYLTQMLDFFGMYLFCFLLLLLNAVRLGWLGAARFPAAFLASVLLMTAFTAWAARHGVPIQGFISILTLLIVLSEVLCRLRARRQGAAPYGLSAFALSLALLLAGAAFSASDVTRKWCDPSNHFVQGHAIWHVLSALSLLAAFYHYRQFKEATAES